MTKVTNLLGTAIAGAVAIKGISAIGRALKPNKYKKLKKTKKRKK